MRRDHHAAAALAGGIHALVQKKGNMSRIAVDGAARCG